VIRAPALIATPVLACMMTIVEAGAADSAPISYMEILFLSFGGSCFFIAQ